MKSQNLKGNIIFQVVLFTKYFSLKNKTILLPEISVIIVEITSLQVAPQQLKSVDKEAHSNGSNNIYSIITLPNWSIRST